VQLISSVSRIGLPLIVVAGSALVLVSAVRTRDRPVPTSRVGAAFIVLVWLRLASEAAFGEQRPVLERQWKGTAALILTLAGAVHLWNRCRRRDPEGPAPQVRPAPATQSKLDGGRAVLVKMPDLGEEITEGTVTRWLKQTGDRVAAGEPLVEVSTDKVDTEVPAGACGELQEIRVPAGRTAPVGTTIAVIRCGVRQRNT
jgi:biotin carboxyl carrier protein